MNLKEVFDTYQSMNQYILLLIGKLKWEIIWNTVFITFYVFLLMAIQGNILITALLMGSIGVNGFKLWNLQKREKEIKALMHVNNLTGEIIDQLKEEEDEQPGDTPK